MTCQVYQSAIGGWPSRVSGGGGSHGIYVCGAGPLPPVQPVISVLSSMERRAATIALPSSEYVPNFLTRRGAAVVISWGELAATGQARPPDRITLPGAYLALHSLFPVSNISRVITISLQQITHILDVPYPHTVHYHLSSPINPSPKTPQWSAMSHQCKASATTWKT